MSQFKLGTQRHFFPAQPWCCRSFHPTANPSWVLHPRCLLWAQLAGHPFPSWSLEKLFSASSKLCWPCETRELFPKPCCFCDLLSFKHWTVSLSVWGSKIYRILHSTPNWDNMGVSSLMCYFFFRGLFRKKKANFWLQNRNYRVSG